MPKKFVSCVKKVKRQHRNVNPYAVCRKSTGFRGSTHHKLYQNIVKDSDIKKCPKCRSILTRIDTPKGYFYTCNMCGYISKSIYKKR